MQPQVGFVCKEWYCTNNDIVCGMCFKYVNRCKAIVKSERSEYKVKIMFPLCNGENFKSEDDYLRKLKGSSSLGECRRVLWNLWHEHVLVQLLDYVMAEECRVMGTSVESHSHWESESESGFWWGVRVCENGATPRGKGVQLLLQSCIVFNCLNYAETRQSLPINAMGDHVSFEEHLAKWNS